MRAFHQILRVLRPLGGIVLVLILGLLIPSLAGQNAPHSPGVSVPGSGSVPSPNAPALVSSRLLSPSPNEANQGEGAGALAAQALGGDPCSVWTFSANDCAQKLAWQWTGTIVTTLRGPITWALQKPTDLIFFTPLCVSPVDGCTSQIPALDHLLLTFLSPDASWGLGWSVLSFLVAVVGLLVMLGHFVGLRPAEVGEALPRVALAFLAATLSPTIVQWLIDLNNILCQVLATDTLMTTFYDMVFGLLGNPANLQTEGVLFTLLLIVFLLLLLLLVGQMILRLAFLIVLTALAPIGLLCFALPLTTPIAKWWFNTLFVTVFSQFIQVLALSLGIMMASQALAVLQATGDMAGLAEIVVAVSVLILTLQIPGKLSKWALDGAGGGGAAQQQAGKVFSEALALI